MPWTDLTRLYEGIMKEINNQKKKRELERFGYCEHCGVWGTCSVCGSDHGPAPNPVSQVRP